MLAGCGHGGRRPRTRRRRRPPSRDAAAASRAPPVAGIKNAGSATGRGASYTLRQARRASHAEGAGDSGLYRLIELHAFNAAGDAAVAISLAGTLFFAQPGEARGQVALFLGLTMLPFAVVAPLLGPFLDRFSHGRRWAIGRTMALRAFLCWLMADAVATQSIAMFPTALGVLVASKAYGVARAATVPRLQPAGPDPGQGQQPDLARRRRRRRDLGAAGRRWPRPSAAQWSLRYAFVVFAGATILSILLPAQGRRQGGRAAGQPHRRQQKFRVPTDVVFALRCNAGLRMLSGFLTMYMAFLLRQHPLPGWEHRTTLLMGLVIGAAGLGNTIGIGLGSVLTQAERRRSRWSSRCSPTPTAAVVAAVFYGLVPAIALGLTAGVAQAMGKLVLDAHDPARRARAPPHLGVRALRDAAPAVLGDRRLHRHRAAAQDRRHRGAGARARRARRADGLLDRVRARHAGRQPGVDRSVPAGRP